MNPSDVVLSVPGGDTHVLVAKYLVHAYPAHYSYVQPYTYITVREQGGRMRAIYSITDIITLQPPYNVVDDQLGADQRSRLNAYVDRRRPGLGFGDNKDSYTFLFVEVAKTLTHAPRTAKTVYNHTYYTVAELTSGSPTVQPRR